MPHLTLEEIAQVENSALYMQALRLENCINIGVNLTDVLKLSLKHGLILFQGNEDTGFEHIRLRHEVFSGKTYWKDKENHTVGLSYPSKFSPNSIPIFDYTTIADAMYQPEFLNVDDNKNPEIFDLYVGRPSVDIGENRKYKMLLYKNTKIIHTLFPTNNKYTIQKPTNFIFHKGGVDVTEELISGKVTITIPYFDHLKEKRYTVVIFYHQIEKMRNLRIVIHRPGKVDLKCDIDPEPFEGEIQASGFLAMQYQVTNLKFIEQFIVDIEKDKHNWINL